VLDIPCFSLRVWSITSKESGKNSLYPIIPIYTRFPFSFVYTDYAIGSVMSILMREGADSISVFYDIFCHWSKGFWNRVPMVLLPGSLLTPPRDFFGGIPKYHLTGHTDSCYARFPLNNMPGVGCLDAKGCERAWADLNHASGSTSEKGPGS
jgi:hypothetical protein